MTLKIISFIKVSYGSGNMFKAKFFDEAVGFIREMKFKSLRLLLNYADKQGLSFIKVNQDDEQLHTCIRDSKKEWTIYKSTKV